MRKIKELKMEECTFIDPRDGKAYRTVKIGEQVWMVDNLAYNDIAEGDVYSYINSPDHCEKYGRLYDWNSVQNVCPPGWHLPSRAEWQALVDFAGGKEIAGKRLKAISGWLNDEEGNSNGTDDFGFAALPSGGSYNGLDLERNVCIWWNADIDDDCHPYYWKMDYSNEIAFEKGSGYTGHDLFSLCSVRCVQNYVANTTFTDSRDGKTYKTVKIGKQIWMAENLAYNTEGSVCYENDTAYCEKYGRLYDRKAAVEACPEGWHLPNSREWQTLVDFVGGNEIAGKRLKATSGWKGDDDGTDDFGFAALPGGYGISSRGEFADAGSNGCWWSGFIDIMDFAYSRSSHDSSYYLDIYSNDWNVRQSVDKCSTLFSVRCVKDDVPNIEKPEPLDNANFHPKSETKVTDITFFTDPRDGRTYRTVKICEQVWMAENLAYNTEGSVCYKNDTAYCEKYGRLYNWETALKVCPEGWHLPSKEEWKILVAFAGGREIALKKLKSKSGWGFYGYGTDEFSFAALPGGYGNSGGIFELIGHCGFWWSASESSAGKAYCRMMNFNFTSWYDWDKLDFLSVRYVKD
jgi:uncharacterized protein (TIGR02145 family)